jgi:hypothetical protein
MRRLAFPILVLVLLATGCGNDEGSTPVACLEGSAFYLGGGRDGVLISECLAENQSGGELANVGGAMLAAATKLNGEARDDPGGEANVQLGYLIGAAQRGAEETEGIHTELIRRLTAAARYSPGDRPLSPAFRRAYRRGFESGAAQG